MALPTFRILNHGYGSPAVPLGRGGIGADVNMPLLSCPSPIAWRFLLTCYALQYSLLSFSTINMHLASISRRVFQCVPSKHHQRGPPRTSHWYSVLAQPQLKNSLTNVMCKQSFWFSLKQLRKLQFSYNYIITETPYFLVSLSLTATCVRHQNQIRPSWSLLP